MLYRFLKIIQFGDVHSLLEIARQLDITPVMVSQVADSLTKQGYLQAVNPGCDTSDQPCTDCLASSSCQSVLKRWILTDKGKALGVGSGSAQ